MAQRECRPMDPIWASHLQPGTLHEGLESFAHLTDEVASRQEYERAKASDHTALQGLRRVITFPSASYREGATVIRGDLTSTIGTT